MKIIAKITTQKRRKDRYNIYLSDGKNEAYAFSVDEAVLIEFHLRKGMELDESMIEALKKKDTIQKSYSMAINFLSYRMRTRKEMEDYLIKKEVEPEHIKIIIERLLEEKLIDDKQFAEMFVRTRISTSSKGPLLIKRELMEKGVSNVIASEAVELYSYDLQYEKVVQLLEKKQKINKRESYKQQIQKTQAHLLQRGFSQAVITDAIASLDEEQETGEEWEALCYQGEKLLRKYTKRYEGFVLFQKMKEGLYRKGFQMDEINRFIDEYVKEESDY